MDRTRRPRRTEPRSGDVSPPSWGAAGGGRPALLLVGVLALLAAACAESEFGFSDPSALATISIDHEVPGAQSSASVSARTVSSDVTVDDGQGFTVDSVVVIMRELQVGRQGTECEFGSPGSDSDGGDGGDCEEAFISTSAQRLPVDSGTAPIVDEGRVDPGTFDRIGFRFNRLDPDEPEDSGVISDLNADFRNVSVLIEGTFQGEAFQLGLDRDTEEVFSADTPLTLEAETSGSMTLRWNVARWFDDGAGGVISPVEAAGDESLEDRIEANLVEAVEVVTSQ